MAAGADTVNLDRLPLKSPILTYWLQTAYSLQAFFLAMVQNPDVLRKAQSELDAVVGSDRLPDFSDRASLPYVNAVIQEVKRWHSVAPVGISHRSTAEDEWNGYRIPAGTVIVPNQWCAL